MSWCSPRQAEVTETPTELSEEKGLPMKHRSSPQGFANSAPIPALPRAATLNITNYKFFSPVTEDVTGIS